MTPENALALLDRIAASVPMNRADQSATITAIQVLDKLIRNQSEASKNETPVQPN